jgi:RNA polymerase sigma-70 factor (ECF subfamily)
MFTNRNILSKESFEELFNKHYEPLCRSSFRIVQNEQTAEDVVQEVYCTLWRRREEITVNSYDAYLYRSVYNASINAIRKEKSRAFEEIEENNIDLPDNYNNPENQLVLEETKSKINKAIESLPAACRTIFLLSRFENKSNKEIATDLNLSIKTVENQMTKSLRIIREALFYFFIYLNNFF